MQLSVFIFVFISLLGRDEKGSIIQEKRTFFVLSHRPVFDTNPPLHKRPWLIFHRKEIMYFTEYSSEQEWDAEVELVLFNC